MLAMKTLNQNPFINSIILTLTLIVGVKQETVTHSTGCQSITGLEIHTHSHTHREFQKPFWGQLAATRFWSVEEKWSTCITTEEPSSCEETLLTNAAVPSQIIIGGVQKIYQGVLDAERNTETKKRKTHPTTELF